MERIILGEHKTNPLAIAAAKGEAPPKKPRLTKAGFKRELDKQIMMAIVKKMLRGDYDCYKE